MASVGDAAEPYIYLGVRKADEPDGYVDPLVLLPAPAPAPVDPAPVEPDPVPAPVHGGANHHHHLPFRSRPRRKCRARRRSERLRPPGRRTCPARPLVRTPTSLLVLLEGGRIAPRSRCAAPFQQLQERLPAPPWQRPRAPATCTIPGRGISSPFPAVAAALGVAVFGARLARRLGELGHTASTNGPATVLSQRAAAPAEDANRLRFRQEDHVVLDRDLERLLLPEREALADLDRNYDPAEVVMWRMIPVFVAPLVERDPNGRSVVPFRPQRISAFRLRGLQGTGPRVLPFLTTISGFGAARSHSYDCRE